MNYRGLPVLHADELDPSDLFVLNVTAGTGIASLLSYAELITSQSVDPNKVLANALWLCALCCVRAAQVVDFDGYEGEFQAEQFNDFQINWPVPESDEEKGTEARKFLETLWKLQEEGAELTFVDLLLGRMSHDLLLIGEKHGVPEDGPMINALHLGPTQDVNTLIRIIDQLLYNAGVPLVIERYTLERPDGTRSTWKALDVGAMSDDSQVLTDELVDTFCDIRTRPYECPPNASALCQDDCLYSIKLLHEEPLP